MVTYRIQETVCIFSLSFPCPPAHPRDIVWRNI
jgi:hypothetical protein